MNWTKLNSSKKIAASILVIFVVSALTQFFVQQAVYSRSFARILAGVEQSTLDLKRESAHDVMHEVKLAVEGSLQRGEYTTFARFAEQQSKLEDLRAFSFVGRDRRVELSSDAQRVGKVVDTVLWDQVRKSDDLVVVENEEQMSFYQPLRVDADMCRLYPDAKPGDLYGFLHLEFSKDKINEMLADARSSSRTVTTNALSVVLLTMALVAAAVCVVTLLLTRRIVKPLTRVAERLKDIASGEGDLTKRLPLRQVNCSAMKKCGQTECSEYGKMSNCWDTVGSNGPTEKVRCPSILSGKVKSCTSVPSCRRPFATRPMRSRCGSTLS